MNNPTNKKVVVMLDGFNPPLKAHIELMRKAIEAVNAYKGIFVMESQDCTVTRRYGRGYTFKEEARLEMLRSIWEHKVIEHEKHKYSRKNFPLCTERNDLYDDEEQDCINGRQLQPSHDCTLKANAVSY